MDNSFKRLMVGQLASFEEMEEKVFRLEEMLKKYAILVQPGSELEKSCLAAVDLLGRKLMPMLPNPLEDIRPIFADALGLWTFIAKLLRLQDDSQFTQLVPHLNLLNSGMVVQNQRSLLSDEACNKLFEMLVALVAIDVGTDLALDDPQNSIGDNPDVLTTIDGRRWGFACKTIYGKSERTLYDRIAEGVDQIQNSPADIGVVVVNFRNLIDHNQYWPILNEDEVDKGAEPVFGSHTNPFATARSLSQLVTSKLGDMVSTIGFNEVRETFEGKKALPMFLAFSQTATGVESPLGPVPTSVGTLTVADFNDVTSYVPVFERLNDAFHETPL